MLKKIFSYFRRKTKEVTPNVYWIQLTHHHYAYGHMGVYFTLDEAILEAKKGISEQYKMPKADLIFTNYLNILGNTVLEQMLETRFKDENVTEENVNALMKELIEKKDKTGAFTNTLLSKEQKQMIFDKIDGK